MRKLISLTLAILMATSLFGGLAVLAAPAEGGIFRAVVGGGPAFDPQTNGGYDGSVYLAQLYEGLFVYGNDGQIRMGAAESYTISDDNLVYTFKMRPEGMWSDGKPVTAHDFEFAYKRLVTPELLSSTALTLGGFFKNGAAIVNGEMAPDELGVKALDDMTLEITLEAVTPYIDDVLCHTSFSPVRSDVAVVGDNGKWANVSNQANVITNGPYKLDEWVEDVSLRFVRNEYYYDPSHQIPEAMEFTIVADDNAALSAYMAGNIDYSLRAPSEEIPRLNAEGIFHSSSRLGTYFLIINNNIEPYSDPRVRKALALSVDPVYIAESVLNNRFSPAEAFIGPGYAGATGDFREEGGKLIPRDDYEGNVAEAQRLLTEAGFPNGEGFPVLSYMYIDNVNNTAIAEALQGFWEENLNITVSLEAIEGGAMGEMMERREFEITRQGWLSDYNDALDPMSIFTSYQAVNAGDYLNEKFNELYLQAQRTPDRAERMAMVHEMENMLLVEDMGTIPLLHYRFTMIYDTNKIDGIFTSPAGLIYFTEVRVAE